LIDLLRPGIHTRARSVPARLCHFVMHVLDL
jgi:hypothetical protein